MREDSEFISRRMRKGNFINEKETEGTLEHLCAVKS